MRKLPLRTVASLLVPCLLVDSVRAIPIIPETHIVITQQSPVLTCALSSMAEAFPKTRLGVKPGEDHTTFSSQLNMPRLSLFFPQSNPEGFRRLNKLVQNFLRRPDLLLVPLAILTGMGIANAQSLEPAQTASKSFSLFWPGIGITALLLIGGIVYWMTRGKVRTHADVLGQAQRHPKNLSQPAIPHHVPLPAAIEKIRHTGEELRTPESLQDLIDIQAILANVNKAIKNHTAKGAPADIEFLSKNLIITSYSDSRTFGAKFQTTAMLGLHNVYYAPPSSSIGVEDAEVGDSDNVKVFLPGTNTLILQVNVPISGRGPILIGIRLKPLGYATVDVSVVIHEPPSTLRELSKSLNIIEQPVNTESASHRPSEDLGAAPSSGQHVVDTPAPQIRKEREPVTPSKKPTLGEEIKAANEKTDENALKEVKQHLPAEVMGHVVGWPTPKEIDAGNMSALTGNFNFSETTLETLRALAAQEPISSREYIGESYAGRTLPISYGENLALNRASDLARVVLSMSHPIPAIFHDRPIRSIKDLDAALREGSQLRRLTLPHEREVKAKSLPRPSLEGPDYRAPWGFTQEHWTLLFELASHTPHPDDWMGNALQQVAQSILHVHEDESQDQHKSDWTRRGLAGEGEENYVLGDMRGDALKRATVPFNRIIRPAAFDLIENRTPDQFRSIAQAIQGQSIVLQRGPYANEHASVRIWTTNDDTVGFLSPRGGRPIPQRISIDYTFCTDGPVLNIRLAGGFAASASDSELTQVILNPLLKLVTGLNDGQAYLAESIYNADPTQSTIVSDLIRHDLEEAFNAGRAQILYEVVRRSIGEPGRRHYDNAMFSMAKPRAEVIAGLRHKEDSINPLYDEAGVIAGDLLVAMIDQRAKQSMAERLRLSLADRSYAHDPASLRQMVLVDASNFRTGLLEKMQGQEENRLQAGIDHAEETDMRAFQGERVATYMSGIDVMPFRSQFLIRYIISVKGTSDEAMHQFLEGKADFMNEGTALAERVVAVNPSVVTVLFSQKSNGEWAMKISGPEVQYRAVLRGGTPNPTDAIKLDPDLLGTFEITESDFRDKAKREAFFNRVIQPPATIVAIPMDHQRIMTRTEIDQQIDRIPKATRPGVGFVTPTQEGKLSLRFSGLDTAFTNTTAFSAYAGSLYVADLSSERGMKPVFYKIYPAQDQWFQEVTLTELPVQIKKDFGITDPTSPSSLHMKWWEQAVRQILGFFMKNPSEWLINAIVSGTEPTMLIGANALSSASGLDLILAPSAAVGFGALHTGRSNRFKAFATFWGLGVILLSRQGYLHSWESYLAVALAQFIVNAILANRHRLLHASAVETTLLFLKAA